MRGFISLHGEEFYLPMDMSNLPISELHSARCVRIRTAPLPPQRIAKGRENPEPVAQGTSAVPTRATMADIVLINPRFEVSFWGLEHALPLLGKRANLPVACLPLLAALTPAEHPVTLIDENVEPIDFDALPRADIVGVTGMSVQRLRMREILTELKRARRLHGRRRPVGHGAGGLLRRPGRRDLRRRGRGDLAAVPRASGREGRHAGATSRPRRPT